MHPSPQQQEAPVGPTRTLPPDQQATPRIPRQRVNDPLELDRATSPELSATPERTSDRAVAMDGTGEQLDIVIGPLEPLDRRTPQPLEASHEAVER
jgi:hypothetical protein